MAKPNTLSPSQARRLFPAVRNTTYLNAAASSPLPLPVLRATNEFLRETAEWGDRGFPRWLARKEEIRAALARLLGASSDEVAFTPSTSMGFNVVGRLLADLGVREVVTLEQEFPSTTLPLLHLGLRLVVVRPREDGSYAVEDLERAVTKRTGALVVSAVQYSSGFRLDLAAAGRLCRARGLYFAVNGAQALGQIPVDVKSSRIDFLCGTSHKWMMGGYGIGIFYARRALLEEAQLPFAGWLSVDDPMAMNNLVGSHTPGRERAPRGGSFAARGAAFRRTAAALEVGGAGWAALLGFGAALELHQRIGVDRTEAHNAVLQGVLRPRLRALGFSPNAPDEAGLGAGICVFPVDGEPRAAARALAEQGVIISPRGGGLRISTHVFNNAGDLDRLFWAMKRVGLAARGPADRGQ